MGEFSLLKAGNWGAGAIAIAAIVHALFRFLRWIIEFLAARMDVGHKRLADRLEHVEQELDAFREATMLMIGVVAKTDPTNPALARVARIIRQTAPITRLDTDELVERLSTIPGTKEENHAASA